MAEVKNGVEQDRQNVDIDLRYKGEEVPVIGRVLWTWICQ